MKFSADVLAANLRGERAKKRFTQADVAEKVGVDTGTIWNYENGNTVPPYDVLWRLADLYGVSLDDVGGRKWPAD